VLKAYIRLKHRAWLEKYMGRELTFEPQMLKVIERARRATEQVTRRSLTEDLSEPQTGGPPRAAAVQPRARIYGLDCPAAARDFPEPRLARVGGWREAVKPLGAWHGHPGPAFPEEGKPLRVLSYLFACRGEGIESWAANLAEACGDQVEWLFMVVGATQITGALVAQYGEVRPHSAFEPESQYWEFLRAVLDFQPHLVHVSHHYGSWFAQHCGLPCLATVHGIIGGKHYGSDWADLSVGVSPAAKKGSDLIAMSGTAGTPWPERRDPNLVIHLGRLDEDRHPELTFEAVERVPEARLRVIGGTHNPQAAEALIAPWRKRLGQRLEYLGQLPRERAKSLAAEGGMIVCGVNESFGFSNAEAMSAGVFPVAIEGAGYQAAMARPWGEVVGANVAGIVQGIKNVLAGGERYTEERRREMAAATAAQYSLISMGEDYLACYRSLAPEVVDLVVLAHNHRAVTQRCVEHLMANTWWPYRLVLVDNGSSDGTHDYFRRVQDLLGWERVKVVRSDTNLGCSLGRNLGLEHCRSPYVYLGDNDMLMPPGWLGPAMGILRAQPAVVGVALNWEGVPGPSRKGGPQKDAPTGTTIVFRRMALGQGFEEPFATLQGREDTDLNWRLLEQGWKFLRLPGIMGHHLGGLTRGPGTTRRDTAKAANVVEAQRLFDEKWAGPGVRRA